MEGNTSPFSDSITDHWKLREMKIVSSVLSAAFTYEYATDIYGLDEVAQ